MTVVCGTDFSESAGRAVDAAAAAAAIWKDELVLVHVLEFPGAAGAESGSLVEAERSRARSLLEKEVARLAPLRVQVRSEVGVGSSDLVLLDVAATLRARVVVVGALGRRGAALWDLGSTADRVAQASRVPVLVVREAASISEWSLGRRALRIVVGVDLTPSSDAALSWLTEIESAGECHVTCAHVYWPPEVKERLGTKGIPVGSGHPEVEKALEGDLRARIGPLRGGRSFDLRLLGGLGRPADHLVRIAEETRADLVVVGTKQRTGLARLWHGSVSRGVIDLAPMNVACVMQAEASAS